MKDADDRFTMFLEPIRIVVDPDGEFPDSLILEETQRSLDDETTSILRLAKEYDGQGQGRLIQAVKDVLRISGAYNKVKSIIPEGKENALPFETGSLWIEPDPDNPQGAKTIRYQQDFPDEQEEDISDLLE